MRDECIDASIKLNLAFYSHLVLESDIQRFLAESDNGCPQSLEKIESRYQIFCYPHLHQETISNTPGIHIKFAVAGSGKTRSLLKLASSTYALYMMLGLSTTSGEDDSANFGNELQLGCRDTTLAWDDIQRVCETQPSLYFGTCINHIGT